jgi:hypothetical protein
MSYPIDAKAFDDVRDALRGVSIAAGYSINLSVAEEQADPVSPRHGTVIVGMAKRGPDDEVEFPALGHDEYWLPIGIQVYAIQSTRNIQTPIRLILQSIVSDVKKALAVDVYRGGYANNTVIPDKEIIFYEDASPPCVLIVAKLHIRTLWDNPEDQ